IDYITLEIPTMNRITINTKLYYLLTHADGEVHKKEEEMGDKMMWHMSMNKDKFYAQIDELSMYDREIIFDDCIKELKTFDKNDQINCLAWMCLIANADGFMDKSEWDLIYKIYHKYLSLNLPEITARQKELHKFIQQYANIPDSSKNEPRDPTKVKNEPSKPTKVEVKTSPATDKPRLSFPM
ncbi:TerB family tellurite resistance protein, partial [Fulvivirga lutimaris]|uniref:TerB family tellurite resistance protein n=1 Tax=Fulvivirga lutimaris TaxID=1819566 RepID=UPI001C885B37